MIAGTRTLEVDPIASPEGMSMMVSSESVAIESEPEPAPLSNEETLMLLNDIWETDDSIQDLIKKKDLQDITITL